MEVKRAPRIRRTVESGHRSEVGFVRSVNPLLPFTFPVRVDVAIPALSVAEIYFYTLVVNFKGVSVLRLLTLNEMSFIFASS